MEKTIISKKIVYDKIMASPILKNPYSLFDKKKNKYELLVNTLKLVNPLNILEKGYSLVKVEDKLVKSSKDVKVKDIVNIKLHEGEIMAVVKEVKNE